MSRRRSIRRGRIRRSGVSLIELQVAFVIFGIALAGLGPLVVMHLRHVQRLENRLNDTTTYYLSPSSDAWARKLGASATISSAPGSGSAAASSDAVYSVQILSLNKSFTETEVSAQVSLTVIPE